MATNGSALLASAAEPVFLALDRMRCLPAPACARRMHPEARPRHDPRRKQATSWLLQLRSRLNAPPLDRLSYLEAETTLDCNHIRSVLKCRPLPGNVTRVAFDRNWRKPAVDGTNSLPLLPSKSRLSEGDSIPPALGPDNGDSCPGNLSKRLCRGISRGCRAPGTSRSNAGSSVG